MRVVGIDPGKDGGLACLDEGRVVELRVMPTLGNELDIPALRNRLLYWHRSVGPVTVFIERQQAMPKPGFKANFVRGYSLGVLEATCSALLLPYELVTPRRWQRTMLESVAGDDTKLRAALAASRLFPDVELRRSPRAKKLHEGLVDALLIAEWGRRRLSKEDA